MNKYKVFTYYKKEEKTIRIIGFKMDKKMNNIFGKHFNDLVTKAMKSINENKIPDPEYYEGEKNLNNILDTIQIIRDGTSPKKIINEYQKHQKEYIRETIRKFSLHN